MSKEINWKPTKRDAGLISKIADRACKMAKRSGIAYKKQTAWMDVTACHLNGCELDLERLLNADDFNFSHDAFGIASHIDRETVALKDCFVPRCAI